MKSKKDLINHLIKTIGEIVEEHKKTKQTLKNVMHLLLMIVNDADINPVEADMKMEEDMEYEGDDPENIEVESKVFTKGDTVELWDSAKKISSGKAGVIVKLRGVMVKIKVGKKHTKSKYGKIRRHDNN